MCRSSAGARRTLKGSPRAGHTPGCCAVSAGRSLKAREDALRDLGGLLVEMYRRGGFRDDLLAERAATVVGIDARLAEIEELLHDRRRVRALRVRRADPARLALLPELRAAARRAEAPTVSEETVHRAGPQGADGREAAERSTAIAAADGTCPRCGAGASRDQRYCLDCGLRAARRSTGRLPSLRRRWIRRFGWYPGRLGLGLAADAGRRGRRAPRPRSRSPTIGRKRQRGRRSPPPDRRLRRRADAGPDRDDDRSNTSTLPTAPEPERRRRRDRGPRNGRFAWPANENGWTIVLVSYPKTNGRRLGARRQAAQAAKAGLARSGSSTRRATRASSPATRRLHRDLRLEGRRRRRASRQRARRVRRRLLAPDRALSAMCKRGLETGGRVRNECDPSAVY